VAARPGGEQADGHYPFQVERAVETLGWVGRAALSGWPDQRHRGALVVEPRRWDPRAATEWTTSIRGLARARGWPIDEVRLVRELPVIPGPAAKIDTVRLAWSVAGRRKTTRASHRPAAA
jgi:hypothetical protein